MAEAVSSFINYPLFIFGNQPQQSQAVECIICRSDAYYRPEKNELPDSLAILPCGHVFCRSCIDVALRLKNVCPTCRMTLQYRKCGHAVEPQVLHEETLLLLPPTIRSPEELPEDCAACKRQTARHHGFRIYRVNKQAIDAASEAYRRSNAEVDGERLSAEQKRAHAMVTASYRLMAAKQW